jgi:hypothetical protein
MNPFEFLNNAIVNVLTGLTERYGTRSPNYVPPSNPVPQPRPTTSDIPFGPYQPLINDAERVKDAVNARNRRQQEMICKVLGDC